MTLTEQQVNKNRQAIGRVIEKARLNHGYSYYYMAKHSGVPIGRLQQIEAGSTAYTVDSLIKVCAFLEIKSIKV